MSKISYKGTIKDRLRWKFQRLSYNIKTIYIEIGLKILRSAVKKSNLIDYAKQEFLILGYEPPKTKYKTDSNNWIQESVLDLLALFLLQGHSGFSASYCIDYFKKLANFKPLSPIKCDDSEWSTNLGNDDTYQNKRLSSVFKDGKEGKPYYLNAIIFKGEDGSCFIGNEVEQADGSTISSRQYINLPFTPKTFYVDVIETEWADQEKTIKQKGGGWWTFAIKDKSQLDEVFEYYKRV